MKPSSSQAHLRDPAFNIRRNLVHEDRHECDEEVGRQEELGVEEDKRHRGKTNPQ